MIPKKIHYCWFGGKPLPHEYEKYINSWKKFCPDYEIKRWDESNFDLNSNDFVKEAYNAEKWSFVSDYARLKIIFDEGGIYLDTDVQIVKNLDFLLINKCFFAEEIGGYVNTGLGFGSEKGNIIVKDMMSMYDGHFLKCDGSFDMTPCPEKNTKSLIGYGYQYSGENIWKEKNVTVYPPQYFCPMDFETGNIILTSDTVSIHHYSAEWHSITEKKIIDISRKCISKFGKKRGKKIAKILIIPYAIKNIIEKKGVRKSIIYLIEKTHKKNYE